MPDNALLSPSAMYDLLDKFVQPRPVVIITTTNEDGSPNIALFSHFTVVGTNPPTVAYCPSDDRTGLQKSSFANAVRTGEFSVSMATKTHIEQLYRGEMLALKTNLGIGPGTIAGSPLVMACRVLEAIEFGSGPHASNIVIGQIFEFCEQDDEPWQAGTIGSGKFVELSTFSMFECKS